MVILLVEDEPFFRSAVKRLLRKEGFHVIESENGVDAYKIVREIGRSIDLVLTDYQMPRMDGFELAQLVTQLYPDMPVLLMTGYASSLKTSLAGYAVLSKPFRHHDLVQAIRKQIVTAAVSN